MERDEAATRFMAVVYRLLKAAHGELQPTGAAILAAIDQGVGSDSRSLANSLGIAHALVLREISTLSGTMLHVVRRDDRTQRTFVELTVRAQTIALAASTAVNEHSVSSSALPETP